MDHHCPWIDNCVGWRNHKSFLLSVFYSSLLCIYLGATMFESVERAINATSVEFSTLFLLLFGETLDFFLSIIVTGFFVFHLYLMLNGMTTIEFCEKQYRWRANREHEGEEETRYQSVWDRGAWKNFNDTFGSNPLLWFLPIDNRPGNGINFIANRSFRPSTHPSHIRLDQEEEGRRLRAGKDL
ncbi:cell cycle regulator with zn-finger domain-containing protein [Cystoisospora suis]|uniref:Palmitoyltransferase n=1 Tax=Cystoisospora suis TaxID=483139 RepID=A0A2C6L2G7_9APIC|nr:cell cycle regulator with zn-finger domain-containing protein [Cystoisospora suis]